MIAIFSALHPNPQPPHPKILTQTHLAMLYNVVKELSPRDIFHHHEDVSRCANHLVPAVNNLIDWKW